MASRIRVGPARMPSRESPEAAVELLLQRGYDACEIDFESGFWMDYPFAERLGELAREHDLALSVHAPLFGFMTASPANFSTMPPCEITHSETLAKNCVTRRRTTSGSARATRRVESTMSTNRTDASLRSTTEV